MSCSSCDMYKQSSSSQTQMPASVKSTSNTSNTTCALVGGSISAAITGLVVYVLMFFFMKRMSMVSKLMYSVIIGLVVGALVGYLVYSGDAPQMILNLCQDI